MSQNKTIDVKEKEKESYSDFHFIFVMLLYQMYSTGWVTWI